MMAVYNLLNRPKMQYKFLIKISIKKISGDLLDIDP